MGTLKQPDLPGRTNFPDLPWLHNDWNLSPELFDAFLAWLHTDRDQAGRRYESIRLRLIKIFTCRGCTCPEDLADETINRVIIKLPQIRKGYQGDPGCYFGGVARHVFQEYARQMRARDFQRRLEPARPRERELACLDECLSVVSEGQRALILRYYEGEKRIRIQNRSSLAHELRVEPNALRIKAHRIRAALQRCVGDCLARCAG
jgi:hypothetical protein